MEAEQLKWKTMGPFRGHNFQLPYQSSLTLPRLGILLTATHKRSHRASHLQGALHPAAYRALCLLLVSMFVVSLSCFASCSQATCG